MRKKQKKKPNKAPPSENIPFFPKKETGRFKGESTVVYSFSLPDFKDENFQESAAFLEEVKKGYQHFLEKESHKKREGVYLGTLSYEVIGNLLTLFSSFAPFEEKEEKEVATLLFSETGKLVNIKT